MAVFTACDDLEGWSLRQVNESASGSSLQEGLSVRVKEVFSRQGDAIWALHAKPYACICPSDVAVPLS
jgi:hypothetical protein